jgi:hypothetical protein
MKVGTRSLLYGVHQVIWHPIFVYFSWWWLFGRPSFGEAIAIVIHDWGYWGKPNMDGPEGDTHPEWAALFFEKRGRPDLADLCRGHSRFWAKKKGVALSKLCYADKLGNAAMPIWLWSAAAMATGEYEDYCTAEKHEVTEEDVRKKGVSVWFREYRYLVFKIIGQDLGRFKRNA